VQAIIIREPSKRREHIAVTTSITNHLTVSLEVECVVALPCLPPTCSGLVEAMTLAKTTRFLASGSEATRFTVLVNRLDDPVDADITTNCLVLRINKNNLIVFVGRVLVDPVGVEDSQVGTSSSNTLLGCRLKGSLVLQLVDTLVDRLAICGTLWRWALASTTSNTDSVDDIALLGLITKTAGLIRSRWSRGTMNDVQLSKLPASNPEKETQHIRLFLLLKLFDVFEGTHVGDE
jgi:hypothetical protein